MSACYRGRIGEQPTATPFDEQRTIELISAGCAERPSELKAADRTSSTLAAGSAGACAWSAASVAVDNLRRLCWAGGAELLVQRGARHSLSRATIWCRPPCAAAHRITGLTALLENSNGDAY